MEFGTQGNLIEIHHCREGRIEQEFEDEYFYLMPGEIGVEPLSVVKKLCGEAI